MQRHKSIGEENPNLIQYFVNQEDAFKYALYSNKKALLKCPMCGKEREMQIAKLADRGFNCYIVLLVTVILIDI